MFNLGWDPRGHNIGFSIRSWITRRAMQRHLWRPAQHTIGPLGLTKKAKRRIVRFSYLLGALSVFGIVYGTRTTTDYIFVFTPLHIWMADVGIFPHGDIGYLRTIGEGQSAQRFKVSPNQGNYLQAREDDARGLSKSPVNVSMTDAFKSQPFSRGTSQLPAVVSASDLDE